jgi:hypothetical protein
MSEHTPTPWFLNETDNSFQVQGDGKEVFYSKSYDDVAPKVQDARFIVRAVNSHDVLIAALKMWEMWYSDESTEFNRDFAREMGLAAIKFAEEKKQ